MKFSAVAAWVMIGSSPPIGMRRAPSRGHPRRRFGSRAVSRADPQPPRPADAPAPLDPPAASASEGAPEGIAPVAPRNPRPETEPEGRILGIMRNNKTVPAVSPVRCYEPPLTIGEKYWLATKDSIRSVHLVLAGFYAGIAQWQDDYPAWRLGARATQTRRRSLCGSSRRKLPHRGNPAGVAA